MSEEKTEKNTKEEEKKTDSKEEEEEDLVDVNVAILKADVLVLRKENAELKDKLDTLMKKYGQAVDLIENDSKARLLADIAPRTSVPDNILAMKTVEELKAMKKVLDSAKVPAFKSATPMTSIKDSPHAKLDNMFADYAKKTWRKDK